MHSKTHVVILIIAILLVTGISSIQAAYDWLFLKAPGELTVVSEEQQGSTEHYYMERIVIKPPGLTAEEVPMLLCLPRRGYPPHSVVLLLHGHGGNKEWPVERFATALAREGIASLAYDFPDHGERYSGNGTFWDDWEDIARVMSGVILSVTDGRWAMDYLEMREEINPGGMALMGYSLGSYLGCILTDVDDRIAGLVMNVGGTDVEMEEYIKDTYGWLIWILFSGAFFPTTHAPDIAPRPTCMLNGLYDDVVLPSDSWALYDALREPKEITWYESGHDLPVPEATDDAVAWLVKLLGNLHEVTVMPY